MKHKEYPEEKLGTKYRLINNRETLPKGTIVLLSYNDTSTCPFFRIEGESQENCIYWKNLKKIQPKTVIGGEVL